MESFLGVTPAACTTDKGDDCHENYHGYGVASHTVGEVLDLWFEKLSLIDHSGNCVFVLSPCSCVRRTTTMRDPLIDPAIIVEPVIFPTSWDSPVTIDSSVSEALDSTIPSVKTLNSGIALNTSPNCNSLASISTSSPSVALMRRAVGV